LLGRAVVAVGMLIYLLRVGPVHDKQSVVSSGAIGGVRVTSAVALPPTTQAAGAASTGRNERDNQPTLCPPKRTRPYIAAGSKRS
jgi:hypothetical protein